MSGMCPDRDRDVARFSGFSWRFLGHSEQGYSLIFRNFYTVSGTQCAGHVQDAIATQLDFLAFLGRVWHTVCRPCPGCVLAMVGTKVDFKAHKGSTVCKPCQGCRYTKAYFHAHEGSTGCGHMKIAPSPIHVKGASTFRQYIVHTDAHRRHTRHLQAHDVQAMSGMRTCFQAFVGNFEDKAVYGTRCIGHIQDASWSLRGRRLIFRHTKVAWCAGHVMDVGTFPGISGLFLGHVVQAMSRRHPGRRREAA
ncbi:---NA--- [Olea europaea subsp. europaea]|uniref:---NA n=1 Tax=Olea europaea subsp. europaea TaxID=158383 RepID=A0A8S0TA60_OLEEU|nr:---NA--- [Olea europaea subsp. europaea]